MGNSWDISVTLKCWSPSAGLSFRTKWVGLTSIFSERPFLGSTGDIFGHTNHKTKAWKASIKLQYSFNSTDSGFDSIFFWLLFGIAIAVGMPSAVKASFEMVRYDDVWFLALNICITPLKVRRSMLALQLPSCFAYAVSCESYASRATAWANGDMVSMDIYGHHREVLFLVLFLVLTQALEESPDHLTMIEHTRASLGCCRSSEHAMAPWWHHAS